MARAPPACQAAGVFHEMPVAFGGAAGSRGTSGRAAGEPAAGDPGAAPAAGAVAGSLALGAAELADAAPAEGPGTVERRQATKPSTMIATMSTPAIQRIMFVDLAISSG